MEEIIELKFEGNNIRPSAVKASEVAELIINFEGSILAIINERNPEINKENVIISFEEIKDESLGLKCLAKNAFEYVVIPAYLTITNAFQTKDFIDIPNGAIENLRSITRFATNHGCNGIFLRNNERLVTFQPNTEITYNQNDTVKGETTIYGEIKKAGGEVPRVQIKIDNNYTVSFEVKKEIAITLASKLYSEVGLTGIATWNKNNYKILDFKAESVVFIEETDLEETFQELGNTIGNYITDANEYF